MSRGNPSRARAAVHALATALACAAVPGSAFAAAGRPADGDLSSRLAELSRPALRSASKAKQAEELSLPVEGPGSLLRDGRRIIVEVRFDRAAAAGAGDLRAAGAEIVNVSAPERTVTVAAKPAQLRALSAVPDVSGVSEVLTPLAAATVCPAGPTVSEGDGQLRAAKARSEFGVDGSGVTVGILSDSFDKDGAAATHAAEDAASGDLPGPGNTCAGQATTVSVLEDWTDPEGTDEGRAMAQIVHDLAPGAQLSFATAFTGLTAFASNIEALAAAGAKVIVDDVSYFEEPFFQEGPVGVAIGKVAEGGVNYFSAAGNNNLIFGEDDVASWEAPQFRDSAGCPGALVALSEFFEGIEEEEGGPVIGLNPSHCMDFDPRPGAAFVDRTYGISVAKGATLTVDLQWAEPWEGVSTDLDAFLFSPAGELLGLSADDNVAGKKPRKPFELLAWENDTGKAAEVRLVVNRYSGGTPRLKVALLQNGGGVVATEYPEKAEGDVFGPTIFGHNGAEDAISVAAVPYFDESEPEPYSSRGPVTHYFGPVSGETPAAPLGSPLVLDKPDVAATDGGANSFFGLCISHTWRFFGTSAAAPHVAAVAALERDAVEGASADEVEEAMLNTAVGVGGYPATAVGNGLVHALAAVAELKSEPFSEDIIKITPPAPQNCGLPPTEPPPISAIEEAIVNTNTAANPESLEQVLRRRFPQTFIRRHPAKLVRVAGETARVVFRFAADESGATFLCRLDKESFHPCRARVVRRLGLGAHAIRAKARDSDGNVDATPAVFRFRAERAE